MSIEVKENFDAKILTSFKVSGIVERAYFPTSTDDLIQLLKTIDNPTVLGNCSNILISSAGFAGDLIFTTKCNKISFDGNKVSAECGIKGPMASKQALENDRFSWVDRWRDLHECFSQRTSYKRPFS